MSPNTQKQKALRRVEKAVGKTMPREVWRFLSELLPSRDINTLADWIASDASDDDIPPIDDFEEDEGA